MFLRKCSKRNLDFQNWAELSCLGDSTKRQNDWSTKRLAAQSTGYALRNWQDKQEIVKINK